MLAARMTLAHFSMLSVMNFPTDPAPLPLPRKSLKRGNGLYLLVGGRKPYTIFADCYSPSGPRLQMKLMVIPVGRSLVFSGSQTKNISYSTSDGLGRGTF